MTTAMALPPVRTRGHVFVLHDRPLYFPFPSGALRYQCVGCDAPCCKGQPLVISRSRELVTLQAAQPRAALFAAPHPAGNALLTVLPPDRCWFLSRNSTCRLENAVGRDAKPTGCRLFPFSRIVRAGEAVVVLPDFLCPLALGRKDDGADGLPTIFSHVALARELVATQLPSTGHPALPDPSDMEWQDALHIERLVVGGADEALESGELVGYLDMQQALTNSYLSDGRDVDIRSVLASARRVLGGGEAAMQMTAIPVQLGRELATLSGVLRMLEPVLPRRVLPRMLAVHALLCTAAVGARGAKPSLRGHVQLWQQRLPLLYALAHLEGRPVLNDVSDADVQRFLAEHPLVAEPLAVAINLIRRNGDRSMALTLDDILRGAGEHFRAPLQAGAIATLYGLGAFLRRYGLMTLA
jgi:hypothetical protein